MKIGDEHSVLPRIGTIPPAETTGLAVGAPSQQSQRAEVEGGFGPDAREHFRQISDNPRSLASMLALCASKLVRLGEDPSQVVKIARHGVTHGYYIDRDLGADADMILNEAESPAPLAE